MVAPLTATWNPQAPSLRPCSICSGGDTRTIRVRRSATTISGRGDPVAALGASSRIRHPGRARATLARLAALQRGARPPVAAGGRRAVASRATVGCSGTRGKTRRTTTGPRWVRRRSPRGTTSDVATMARRIATPTTKERARRIGAQRVTTVRLRVGVRVTHCGAGGCRDVGGGGGEG